MIIYGTGLQKATVEVLDIEQLFNVIHGARSWANAYKKPSLREKLTATLASRRQEDQLDLLVGGRSIRFDRQFYQISYDDRGDRILLRSVPDAHEKLKSGQPVEMFALVYLPDDAPPWFTQEVVIRYRDGSKADQDQIVAMFS